MSGLEGQSPQMNAGELVNDAWSSWKRDASDLAESSIGFLNNLNDIDVAPIDTSGIVFDYDSIPVPPNFTKPPVPTIDALDVNAPPIPNVPGVAITAPTLTEAPEYDIEDQDYYYIDPPNFTTQPPNTDVDILYPTVPKAPILVYPDAPDTPLPKPPTVVNIEIPPVPTIDLPTWSQELPPVDFDVPDVTITYTEEEYASDLLTEITETVTNWLKGGTGIPAPIWDAIFDKARSNEEKEQSKLLTNAREEWSSKGFELPSGIIDRKLRDIRTESNLTITTLNRDIAIKRAEMEQDNIRYAMQQGVALEAQMMDLFNQSKQRLLTLQELQLNYASTIFGMQVQLYNAKLDGYKTESQVFNSLIQAELAKLETYKVQLEGEKLKLEISQVETDIYKTQIQALATEVDMYKTQVDAVVSRIQAYTAEVNARNVILEGEKLKLEALDTQIKSYATEVDAYKALVESYSTRNENNKIKADVYNTAVTAYAQRINAYKATSDVNIAYANEKNTANRYLTENYLAKIDAIKAQLQQEQLRVQSLIQVYDGQAKVYQAQGSVNAASSNVDIQRYQAQMSVASDNAKVAAEKAKVDLEQVLRIAEIESANARTASQVYGQVGAATLAGVSMSAQLSEASQWSNQYSVNHNYSYQ